MNIERLSHSEIPNNLIQNQKKPMPNVKVVTDQFKLALGLYLLSFAHIRLMSAFSLKITLLVIIPALAITTFVIWKMTMSKEDQIQF